LLFSFEGRCRDPSLDVNVVSALAQEALERLAKGETLVDVARTFGVDATTIGRLDNRPFGIAAA